MPSRARTRLVLSALAAVAVLGVGFFLYQARIVGGAAARGDGNRTLRPEQEILPEPASKGARIALVIGNGAYEDAPLRNPVNDAKAMKAALEGCQFEVTLMVNTSKRDMEDAIQSFGDRIRGGAVGLFYYAGHGVAVKGVNYLIPVDAKLSREDDVPYEGVDVGRVLDKMDTARNQLNILILDACRNNPFARSWRSASKGLVQVSAPKGSLIAYATAPGSTAADGNGEHGLYTEALLARMKIPGESLLDLFQDVRAQVEARSQGQQVPWESNSTVGRFYFRPMKTQAAPSPLAQPQTAQVTKTPLVSPLSTGPALTPPVPGAHRNPKGFWESQLDLQNTVWGWFRSLFPSKSVTSRAIALIEIPAGSFTMGIKVPQGHFSPDGPAHQVTLTQAFWMGKFPVTQGQWQAVMGNTPSFYQDAGLDAPVEEVSWDDAQQFLAKLNGMQQDWIFRLPTEAEWEYACRAGDQGEQDANLDAIAWYDQNSGDKPHPVGQKQPNAFGLYDMQGNVLQWCQDWSGGYPPDPAEDPKGPTDGEFRILRGGSFVDKAEQVRSTSRNAYAPDHSLMFAGFRVCAVARVRAQ